MSSCRNGKLGDGDDDEGGGGKKKEGRKLKVGDGDGRGGGVFLRAGHGIANFRLPGLRKESRTHAN